VSIIMRLDRGGATIIVVGPFMHHQIKGESPEHVNQHLTCYNAPHKPYTEPILEGAAVRGSRP
jgi:hypothetical protein